MSDHWTVSSPTRQLLTCQIARLPDHWLGDLRKFDRTLSCWLQTCLTAKLLAHQFSRFKFARFKLARLPKLPAHWLTSSATFHAVIFPDHWLETCWIVNLKDHWLANFKHVRSLNCQLTAAAATPITAATAAAAATASALFFIFTRNSLAHGVSNFLDCQFDRLLKCQLPTCQIVKLLDHQLADFKLARLQNF